LSLLLTLIATPVVYSLLDDLRATSRWRRLASITGSVSQSVVGKLKRPRRARAREATAERAEPSGEQASAGGD